MNHQQIQKTLASLVAKCKHIQQKSDIYEARSINAGLSAARFICEMLRNIKQLLSDDSDHLLHTGNFPTYLIFVTQEAIFVTFNITIMLIKALSQETLSIQDMNQYLNAIQTALDYFLSIFQSDFIENRTDTQILYHHFIATLKNLQILHRCPEFSQDRFSRLQNQFLGIQLCQHLKLFNLEEKSLLNLQQVHLLNILVAENTPDLRLVEPLFPLFASLAVPFMVSCTRPNTEQWMTCRNLLQTLDTLNFFYPDRGWNYQISILSSHLEQTTRDMEALAIKALLQLRCRNTLPADKTPSDTVPGNHPRPSL